MSTEKSVSAGAGRGGGAAGGPEPPVGLAAYLPTENGVKTTNALLKSSAELNLSLIGYPSLLLSAVVKKAAQNKKFQLALVFLLSKIRASDETKEILSDPTRLAVRLRTLYSLTSDIRTYIRVWGSLDYAEWAYASLKPGAHPDKVLKWLDYLQLIACIVYQALENVAYLGSHKVLAVSPRLEARLWSISCIAWAVYVQLDFIKLAKRKDKFTWPWTRALLVNCAYVPLSIHWSLEQGCLSDGVVGALGTFTAYSNAIPKWRQAFV